MSYITVQICGGLGNQMFQYAMGRALSLQHHASLILDISWFSSSMLDCTKREFLLDKFPNIATSKMVLCYDKYAIPKWKRVSKKLISYIFPITTLIQPELTYWPQIEHIPPPVRLAGYWQSEKFFSTCTNKIMQDFTFPDLPEGTGTFLAKKIQSTPNSVSLHIRRGDYISNAKASANHGFLGQNYYQKSLQYIKNEFGLTTIFIFSDDPDWVAKNFDCNGHTAVIIDLHLLHSPYHDMHLMSLCKHHIIANSTFSWWGAWLSMQRGLTIAPQKWFAKKKFEEYKDIYCKDWIIL